MTSISRNRSLSFEPAARHDCLAHLLRAIQRHLVVANDADAAEFRAELAKLEEQCGDPQKADQLVAATVDLLEHYTRGINQFIGQQKSELGILVGELTSAMAALPDIQQFSSRISTLEKQVEAASSASDVQACKARLRECLALARGELLTQKQTVSDLISGAIERMRASESRNCATPRQPMGSVFSPDPLTGLPGRAYAEAELARIHAQWPDCQMAIFIVRRLHLINAKFGFSRGDQVLLRVVQHLAQALPDYNNLFRWTPCSFLIITSPAVSHEEVRRQVQQIELQRITLELEWEGRSALVPIGLDCRVLSFREHVSPDSFRDTLDALVCEP